MVLKKGLRSIEIRQNDFGAVNDIDGWYICWDFRPLFVFEIFEDKLPVTEFRALSLAKQFPENRTHPPPLDWGIWMVVLLFRDHHKPLITVNYKNHKHLLLVIALNRRWYMGGLQCQRLDFLYHLF